MAHEQVGAQERNGLWGDMRNQLRCAALKFGEEDMQQISPSWRMAFGRSTFCGKDSLGVTLSIRTACVLLMCGVFFWSWSDHPYAAGYWWIYLTKWTLTLQCIYHILVLLLAIRAREKSLQRPGQNSLCLDTSLDSTMPTLAKGVWLLQAVCLPATFLVFVLYWGLVFPKEDGAFKLVNAFTHGVNFFVMILDAWTSRFPVLLVHGVYFILYALIYLIWTLVHYNAGLTNEHGDPYIYAALDWRNPSKSAILAFLIIGVAAPIVFCSCWRIVWW